MLIEVCANSLQSALNAEKAGANRIELCTELGVGGVTPSYGLITAVKEQVNIPVHVLVRPRCGHFTYSKTEFEVLLKDIEFCKNLGVDGIVSGVLNSDATLDLERTKQLVELSKPLHFTFHRAFDWVSNPLKVLSKLEAIGVDTILTSGKHLTAENGIELLKELNSVADKISIMAGAGVNLNNIKKFMHIGFKAIHLSGTSFGNEVSINRKVPMNSQKHLEEHHVAVTNVEVIRQIVQSVK
ncbi:copper homeostasis protein CutC [Croceitalea sp. MTPC9]|uniref:copper homeostasis protein CutC n=1 Tax=unclassified Croceitalea TaxID=2632280 RepID=UPI002B38095E|nr:copper homeostasis protein CutC [Croceitalea sp. MTPC6]GMN18389.1 copper homeostasis protein CutC [Croceitalea sp. MTPC9]